jgi:hypothetical protein
LQTFVSYEEKKFYKIDTQLKRHSEVADWIPGLSFLKNVDYFILHERSERSERSEVKRYQKQA